MGGCAYLILVEEGFVHNCRNVQQWVAEAQEHTVEARHF
jgi:hypothetical protein